jgi:hypothetical protein
MIGHGEAMTAKKLEVYNPVDYSHNPSVFA